MTAAIACFAFAGCAADARPPRGDPEPVREQPAQVAVTRGEAAPVAVTLGEPGRAVVTRDDPDLPAGCRPGSLARRIAAFLDAFNRGDPFIAADICPPPRSRGAAIVACARRWR